MKLDLAKTNGSSPPSTTTRTMVGKDLAIVAPALTTATHPTLHEIVGASLEEPAIKTAIQRGTRKVRVQKYAAITKSGRDGVSEHTSDFVQATYLALLEDHAEGFAALMREQRAGFVEKLAMSVSWKEVYCKRVHEGEGGTHAPEPQAKK